jgi:hypothetical protein
VDPVTLLALIRAGIEAEELIRHAIKNGRAPKLPDGTVLTSADVDKAVAEARAVVQEGIAVADAELAKLHPASPQP